MALIGDEKKRGLRMDKKIYWHLPGFCYLKNLNQVIIELM